MVSENRKPAAAHGSLPPTEQLLVAGGDARIALDAEGLNRYGCPSFPDPELLSLGSSTASCISAAGFAAADRLRNRLAEMSDTEPDAVLYARELERIRQEFVGLCGVSGLHGLDVVFAASGTDLHLIAAQLAGAAEPKPMFTIMVDAAETGSGVPAALAGRHFSSRVALGNAVPEGEPILDDGMAEGGASSSAIEVATVAIRNADGTPRPASEVDAEFEARAIHAAEAGRRVLLVLADVSKTGLVAPSPASALALRQRLPQAVDVLVDACQFRIAPPTLRAYLKQGCMVALTGSKFVTGPPFSGALLIPAVSAHSLRGRTLPRALSAYSTRSDWPENWRTAGLLDDVANFGLLLRWEAALEELRAFRAVPEEEVADFLRKFASAICQRLANDPFFEMLPVSALDRSSLGSAAGWDSIQTIFPFRLVQPEAVGGKRPLGREDTARIYRLLQIDLGDRPDSGLPHVLAALRCQLGQPVECGYRDGVAMSALRLCASARMVVAATAQGGRNANAVIKQALAALDKAALLVRSCCWKEM